VLFIPEWEEWCARLPGNTDAVWVTEDKLCLFLEMLIFGGASRSCLWMNFSSSLNVRLISLLGTLVKVVISLNARRLLLCRHVMKIHDAIMEAQDLPLKAFV
jgi:hypothetical protein